MGDANHQTGVVLAEIVKANIPVRNGVVHLIQRPLMVVDNTVKDFLEVSARSSVRGPIHEHCTKLSVLIHSAAMVSRTIFLKRSGGRIINAEISNTLVRDIALILSIYLWNRFVIK